MTPRAYTTAAGYHRITSYRRHRLTPHALDWHNQPTLAKSYPDLPRTPLARDLDLPAIDYFTHALQPVGANAGPSAAVDVSDLAAVLHQTHAVTARSMHAGHPFYFRNVASAGALYPFELYVAAHHIDGLDSDLYHFDPVAFAVTALRRKRPPVLPAAESAVAATFYISGIFFRSAWKYRSRAYRYVLLDAGHLLENLRLSLGALKHPFSVHLDFDDDRAAAVLGIDPEREVCLCAVHLYAGCRPDDPQESPGEPVPLDPDIVGASRVADQEIAYPEILGVHRAGNGKGQRRVAALPALRVFDRHPTSWIDIDTASSKAAADYLHVLRQRRSRRNFIPAVVSHDSLMTFLQAVGASLGDGSGVPAAYRSALTVGLLAGAAMPVPPGSYVLDPHQQRLGRIADGDYAEAMAAACLDQRWLMHAAGHLLVLTEPAALDRAWGARGYRYAMIEAGRVGQQAYLAATALGWGACGIGAIYDREAADLIGLTGNGALLYLIGVGPVKTR